MAKADPVNEYDFHAALSLAAELLSELSAAGVAVTEEGRQAVIRVLARVAARA